ncbi:tensin-4-like [Brienomyrus brachyistius]|uniref:tensin-4-like n=1 Tax=Brienomyrus brachyistius TaxID=42636 RepID=UPI0020B2A207|nr:tensin-4-like [Brienomyrus brachyistius]
MANRDSFVCMTPISQNTSQAIPTAHVQSFGKRLHLPAKVNDLSAYSLSHPLSTECWAGSQRHADYRETDPISPTLDISLENLNQLILELDPTFEPICGPSAISGSPDSSPSTATDTSPEEDSPHPVQDKWCFSQTQHLSPSVAAPSSSVPIPLPSGTSCSPNSSLIFSGSHPLSQPPQSSRSKVPLSASWEVPSPSGSLHLLSRCRGSGCSLLSCSPKSDTSYVLGSCHSLLSDDADCPDCSTFDSTIPYNDVISSRPQSPRRSQPSFSEHKLDKSAQILHTIPHRSRGVICTSNPNSCSSSVAGSVSDIPVVLINGAPETKDEATHPQNEHPVCILESQNLEKISSDGSTPSPHVLLQRNQPSIKSVMDKSQFWFRPHITREEADFLLQDQKPGSFVVRNSTSFKGSFGLALKVDENYSNLQSTCQLGDSIQTTTLVRHYLIESSAKGVRLKGSTEEPYFGSLSALVYQHVVTAYALPCRLRIPTHDFRTRENSSKDKSGKGSSKQFACNFLYLRTVGTEMLTGPCALQKAVSAIFQQENIPTPTIVNLMVSPKGITLTDIQRKVFFRQYYPGHLLSYCGEDPDNRSWPKDCKSAIIFGFVSKGNESNAENMCHIFAPCDTLQSSNSAVELIRGIITSDIKQFHSNMI